MKEEILRVIKDLERRGHITVNPHLNPEALALIFSDTLAEMPLKKFVQIFSPDF